MKWNTDDLPVFIALCEMQGIRAAAKRLGMPKSTVSRTLSRLEEGLDVRLVDRNTRQFRLTAEGEAFLTHAHLIGDQVRLANEAFAGLRQNPSGPLKVALPMAFSREVIGSKFAHFTQHYPEIRLDVVVTPYLVNLMREDFDVALVVGPIENSELISRTISDTPLIWVCARDYLSALGEGDEMGKLRQHVKFIESRYSTKRLALKTPKGRQYLDTTSAMQINDSIILRDIVSQGGGIGLLPELYCLDMLRSGHLIQLCPAIIPEARAQIIALTASRKLQPQKARLFIDFAKQAVADYIQQYT